MKRIKNRQFVCCFYFVGWENLSLGISFNFKKPNMEIHLPIGFLMVGWDGITQYDSEEECFKKRSYGITYKD